MQLTLSAFSLHFLFPSTSLPIQVLQLPQAAYFTHPGQGSRHRCQGFSGLFPAQLELSAGRFVLHNDIVFELPLES